MELDKKDLYLYRLDRSFSSYRVGSIRRINDKTITMDDGSKFLKEEFNHKTHKLTDKEKEIYEGAILNKVIDNRYNVSHFFYQLKELNKAIQISPLVTVDTNKLQEKVDELTLELSKAFDLCVEINKELFQVSSHYRLEKVEK